MKMIATPGRPRQPWRTRRRANVRLAPRYAATDDFDRLLGREARRLSAIHWTPTRVCHRAAQLLAVGANERVLDVGSGVGKLCVLGSLTSQGQYVGVEQRPQLVFQSRWMAERLASRAQFVHCDAFEVDWNDFQALYFYNPFEEARFDLLSGWQIDGSIRMGAEVFQELVRRTQARLTSLAIGTRVVTFHGIGGPMPSGYQLQVREQIGDGTLELWSREDPERGQS